MKALAFTVFAGAAVFAAATPASAADWFPYRAEEVTPAFDPNGKASPVEYTPLEKASKPWKICVSFPHMKDAYWLGVDYGVVGADAETDRGLTSRPGPSAVQRNHHKGQPMQAPRRTRRYQVRHPRRTGAFIGESERAGRGPSAVILAMRPMPDRMTASPSGMRAN